MAKNDQTVITIEEVKHIARLANLTLTPEEEQKFSAQLAETIDYIKLLDEVDTSGVEPTSNVTGLIGVTEADEVRLGLSTEAIFANAKQVEKQQFKVKAVLEER